MGFWDSLFGGKNSTLSSDISQFGNVGQQQTGQGQKNENQASNFFSSILSGDSSKQAQALAPEISAAKKSAQEQTKTNAEFGSRSGGTAASTAATNDKVHSDITNLIGSLTNSSATNLASMGESQIGTGLSALSQQEQASQQQMQNWSNSILGKSITGAVSAAESAGLGAVGGAMGGAGAGAGAGGSFGGLTPQSTGGYADTSGFAPTGFFNSSGDYV